MTLFLVHFHTVYPWISDSAPEEKTLVMDSDAAASGLSQSPVCVGHDLVYVPSSGLCGKQDLLLLSTALRLNRDAPQSLHRVGSTE